MTSRRGGELLPGVQFDFGSRGLNTTVGFRSTDEDSQKADALLNLGIPATVLSYRTRVAFPETDDKRPSRSDRVSLPTVTPLQPSAAPSKPEPVEIRSAASGTAIDGLSELKRLINEAPARHETLTRAIADGEQRLRALEQRQRTAQWFIVRLFSQGVIARLSDEIARTRTGLADARDYLAACHVDVDFAFDEPTLKSFAALVRAYEILRQSAAVWDVTGSVTAGQKRVAVRFDMAAPEIVNSKYQTLKFANAAGGDILIYPGFVMIRGPDKDVALIDVRELAVTVEIITFVEDEDVPPDTEVVIETSLRAPDYGSSGAQGDHQIPVVRYALLWLRGPNGLEQAYMFSDASKADRFAAAFRAFQTALLAESRGRAVPLGTLPSVALQDDEADDAPVVPPMAPPARPKMVADWVALAILVCAFVAGALGIVRSVAQSQDQPAAVQVLSAAARPADRAAGAAKLAERPTNVVAAATPALASAVMPAAARATPAPALPREFVSVRRRNVNVRAEPTRAATIVRVEKRGKRLMAFKRSGNWTQIGDTAPTGWIRNDLLSSTARASAR